MPLIICATKINIFFILQKALSPMQHTGSFQQIPLEQYNIGIYFVSLQANRQEP